MAAEDTGARLARLVAVRDRRRQARERELGLRLQALQRAEQALVQQRALLDAALRRLEQSTERIARAQADEAPSGADCVRFMGWLNAGRTAVSTERAAAVAAAAAVDMVRREETKARAALRAAAVAQRKLELAHDEHQAQDAARARSAPGPRNR